jgi:lambda family phage tail tape measure protein
VTWFKVDSLGTMKAMGYDPKLIDAEILKLQAARDKFVEAANQRLANINQNPGYVDQVQRFFDEQRRTVQVMGQKFVLDTAEQAAQVQKIYDEFLPKQPRKKPLALDLSGFQSKGSTEKRDEGDTFLRQLQGRVTKSTEGEAAELRAKALDLEAKGYKGVAAQAEKYITVLDAIEKQKEANKRFDEYEKEEQKSRQIVENFIGANRQRADELQLKRQMLDLSEADRVALQTRADLEKSASAARKEANQLQEPELARQAIEAINDALARQLPIVEDLARANVDYQRSFEYGTKSALRTYIEDATNAAKQAERAVTGAFRAMEDALTSFVTTGKLDFKSMADSIITDLVRIQIQRMITLPLANWASGLFSGGGSDASALPAGATDLMNSPVMVAHSGGLVGAETMSSRSAPLGLFAGAPRFHGGGLVAGEVPIIARQGEAVFTPGQLRALGGAVGAKSEVRVEVNVINRASGVEARVERQQQPDGGMRLDVIVEQMEARMSRSISQGSGLAPTLERRYGLNPAAGSFR